MASTSPRNPSEVTSSGSSEDLPAVIEAAGLPAELPEDGFAEAVPFKALDLRINRSKGEFWLDGDSSPRDLVTIVPRGCHRAQMFYGLPYSPNTPHEPSCQSPDGRHAYGWINKDDQTEAPRKCMGCPRKGFGQGSCTDLMVMLAYDTERESPIMLKFQNAELNPRKGVLTLAVNRFRSMGLRPSETLLTLRFVDTDAAYKALQIDVAKAADFNFDLPTIQETLDVCWAAYEESRGYEIQELQEMF